MLLPIKLEYVDGATPTFIGQFESGLISIGRDTENAIVVDSEAVSRNHSTIIAAGSQWIYQDFGSTNGSWVNGIKVTESQFKLLRNGDIIRVANFCLLYTSPSPRDRTRSRMPSSA